MSMAALPVGSSTPRTSHRPSACGFASEVRSAGVAVDAALVAFVRIAAEPVSRVRIGLELLDRPGRGRGEDGAHRDADFLHSQNPNRTNATSRISSRAESECVDQTKLVAGSLALTNQLVYRTEFLSR